MGVLYVDTGGAATNSGCTDVAAGHGSILSGSACTAAATVVTLDGSPDLSGLNTSGAAQSTINIAGATNANRTIFWITAFDNTLKTVTVDAAPSGLTTNAWKIGGQYLWPSGAGVNVVEGALGLGLAQDILQFNNSPATKTVAYLTSRVAAASTLGPVRIIGKSGTRPVLNVTNTAVCLSYGGFAGWNAENLELQQNGASGNAFTFSAPLGMALNLKISDAGGIGISNGGGGQCLIACEVSGAGANGISGAVSDLTIIGTYSHDNTGDGVLMSTATGRNTLMFNVVDTNTGRGINFSGATAAAAQGRNAVSNNTVYGNGDSGLEVADQDTPVALFNNIFQDNGNAAGEYNVDWAAGAIEGVGVHGSNCFYLSSGSNNVLGLTINSTEVTTDPAFTNAAGGDFSLGTSSSAKATGFPGQILGSNLGYLDMGAIQRQEPAGGSSGGFIIGGM